MTTTLFNQLLKKGENDIVDFKEIGYFTESPSASKKDKDAEFIKDLVSFTNTVREENAYILIGVKDNGEKVGIADNEFTDGAVLQSKIKDKILPIPKFNTYPFVDDNGLKFQIIEIPIEKYSSPCQPTVAIGTTLERNSVYIRRNTSNEKAGYDEIVRLSEWLKTIPAKASSNSKANTIAKNQDNSFQFDEITIQQLFGNEAAEDEDVERLKEYYFKNEIFNKIAVDLPLRILVGHKGIGKSALFNVAMSEDKDADKLPIKIKPNDVAQIGKGLTDFSDIIRNWRAGLFTILFKKTFSYFGINIKQEDLFNFENFEGNFVDLIVERLEESIDGGYVPEKNLDSLENFLSNPSINIYIDDLDRGWEGTKSDITKISALLNAVRDIISEENRRLHFKISLRSDVYFLYRTSDESTDKTQSSVIWYKWSYHEILALLVKRVRTYFKKPVDEGLLRSSHQADLAKNLSGIIEPIFSGQGKWESRETYRVLLSVIRKRPRDLVKLLTLAARNAENRKSPIIATQDLKAIFDEYSLDRIQDTINEYKSELPGIERLIFGMKPDRKTAKTSDSFYYTTQGLLSKINKIRERGEFRFSNGKPADARQLAAFLYKINFLTATKLKDDGFIERKDFEENRYLVPKFEDFGYDWEVHMAFRWGLQPSDQNSIYTVL
ncbi:ATP-binding protein [Flavobacterium sp. J49]|uniref:AlbA family DNA-binding domain-containing protein n=1 Tax=Flavobacterium sp. J49 TaxID=2718534 RepID=UPI001594AACF|nr:ATP-binding protein [Flavobacterium sp. J49]MBF6642024.1 ATP-binding protein [Flavobacterium sp. J49]NIC03272.1 ATP-binding protein [Flavobacterium sp. J49]